IEKVLRHAAGGGNRGTPAVDFARLGLALLLRPRYGRTALEGELWRAGIFDFTPARGGARHDLYVHELHAVGTTGDSLRRRRRGEIAARCLAIQKAGPANSFAAVGGRRTVHRQRQG